MKEFIKKNIFLIIIYVINNCIILYIGYRDGVTEGEKNVRTQIDNIGVQNFITDTIPEISTWR